MSCEARKYHWPPAPACDSHHLVPRAWQAHWRPPGKAAVLWAPETVELCPNDHRGVHERIVALMQLFPDGLTDDAPIRKARQQVTA